MCTLRASQQRGTAGSVAQGWQPDDISQAAKCFRIFYTEGQQYVFSGEFLN